MRIRGKHLRYSMEVFVSCFDESFEEKYYPDIEAMQEILGHANDCHVALERLGAIRAAYEGDAIGVMETL